MVTESQMKLRNPLTALVGNLTYWHRIRTGLGLGPHHPGRVPRGGLGSQSSTLQLLDAFGHLGHASGHQTRVRRVGDVGGRHRGLGANRE